MAIPAGEIVVLVGPSGCGKTTTMKMINRLIEPTSGEITIGGTDVLTLDLDELRRHIGYVIQQIGLFPHMPIADNIGAGAAVLGLGQAANRAPGSTNCSSSSASTRATSRGATRASSPAASSSASASPGHWPRTRRSC